MSVESPLHLALGLVTGIAFGFLLQKGRAAKYETVLGQLLLRDWTIMKIMLTAIVVGAIGVHVLVAAGLAHFDIWPFEIGATLAGALCFGVGLATFGYCPGTSVAASGEGHRDAMIGVFGMLAGATLFVWVHPWLRPIVVLFGDLGKVTIGDVLKVPPAIVITVLACLLVAVFVITTSRQRALGRRVTPSSTDAEAGTA